MRSLDQLLNKILPYSIMVKNITAKCRKNANITIKQVLKARKTGKVVGPRKLTRKQQTRLKNEYIRSCVKWGNKPLFV
jgi:hypothetical protein